MRPLIAYAQIALVLGLAACATDGSGNRYNDELRQLSADCEARGGILSPTGQQTGRPQLDHVCKITGGATRLPNDG
jgi:hypothetical protein